VDVLLANSRSPIDVNFTDIQMSLASIGHNTERSLLTLTVPALSLKKGKNVVFNGSIYVSKIHKKNLAMSMLSTRFALKVDSRLYPRICFIRFPFKRSMSFSLDSPASKSSRQIELKRIHFEAGKKHLGMSLYVNNSKLVIPKFITLRCRGINIFLGKKSSMIKIAIGHIDLHDSFFQNPLKIDFNVIETAHRWIKKSMVRALKGREVGVRIDSIEFLSPIGMVPDGAVEVGLTLGINAKNDSDYDVVFRRKSKSHKPWKPPLGSSIDILFDGNRCINVKFAKKMFPFISDDTSISMSDTGTTVMLFLNQRHLVSLKASITDEERHTVLKLTAENMYMLNFVCGLVSSVKTPGIDIVVDSLSVLGLVLNSITGSFRFDGRMCLRIGRYKLIDKKPSGENNVFSVEHYVRSLKEGMEVDTAVRLNPFEKCYANRYVRLVHTGTVFCLEDLGIGIKIKIKACEVRYVSCGPLSKCLYGCVLVSTQIGDSFERILEHFEKHSMRSNEGRNQQMRSIMECFESRGAAAKGVMPLYSKCKKAATDADESSVVEEYDEDVAENRVEAGMEGHGGESTDCDGQYGRASVDGKEGGFIGNVCIRYSGKKPKVPRKYFFDVVMSDGRRDVDKGLCLRNMIHIEKTSIGVYSKSGLTEIDGGNREDLMSRAPLKLNIDAIRICCVWRGCVGVWLEQDKPIGIGVTISNLNDVMQLMNGDVGLAIHENDIISRNIKTLVDAYLSMDKERLKMASKEGIDASMSIKKRNEKGSVDTYEADCRMCVPKEILGLIGLVDVPSIEVKVVKSVAEHDGTDGHIISMKVYSSPATRENHEKCMLYGVRLCASVVAEYHDPVRMILMVDGNECEEATFMPEECKKMIEEVAVFFSKNRVRNINRSTKKTVVNIDSINDFGVERVKDGFFIDRNTWFVRINDERIKEFVFCRLPNIFLSSSVFSMVPSGVRMAFRVDKDVFSACVKSKKKNPWKETESGVEAGVDHAVRDGYKIFGLWFSDIECEEAIKYDFSSLGVLHPDGRKMLKCEDYCNPFVGSNEYNNWNASIMVAGAFKAWNEGMLCNHDIWCETPFMSYISRLMPKGNSRYKPEVKYAGMYVRFRLPFEICMASKALFEVNMVSKCNDKVLLSVVLRKSMHERNSIFVVATIPSGSYVLEMNHLKRLLDILFGSGHNKTIIQDVTINVFVNKRKCSRFNNRIEIKDLKINKKDIIKAMVFILDKRSTRISDMIVKRFIKKID